MRRKKHRRKNPLSAKEERVVVALGLASLIGIAYYYSVKKGTSA